MKKITRYYGLKKKEKSFVKKFFDENENSSISAFGLDKDLRNPSTSESESEDRNVAENRGHSPFLYTSFSEVPVQEGSLLQDSYTIQKSVKKSDKRFKRAKQVRNYRKKPKLVQHLNIKSSQARWSAIHNYKFIVDKFDYRERVLSPVTPIKRYGEINPQTLLCGENTMPSTSKSINAVNSDQREVISGTSTFPKSPISQRSRTGAINNSLNTSEDMFFKKFKTKKNVGRKRIMDRSVPDLKKKHKKGNKQRVNDNGLSKKERPTRKCPGNSNNMPKIDCQNNDAKSEISHKELSPSKNYEQMKQCRVVLTDITSLNRNNLIRNDQEELDKSNEIIPSDLNSSRTYEEIKQCSVVLTDIASLNRSKLIRNNQENQNEGTSVLKSAFANDTPKSTDFSSGGRNIFQLSDSVNKTKKFITSTPVLNSQRNNLIGSGILPSVQSVLDQRNKSTSSDSSTTSNLQPEDYEADCLPFYSWKNKTANDLVKDPVRKSLQFIECPATCSSKKSKSVQNKKSFSHSEDRVSVLSSKMSLLNLSSSFTQQPCKQISEELAKAKLLQFCNQESVAEFSGIYDWNNFKVKKIGDGSFGEVFMLSKKKLSSVLKIIPVSEDSSNGQKFESLLSEVQISKCLSELRNNERNQTKNFVKVNKTYVVSGSYPAILVDAWDKYSIDKSCYVNSPEDYDENQIFVILELEYGGKDMECFMLRNAVEAESILKQITVSLAIAEEEYLFEHRDLHLGNILVHRSRRKNISYKLRGREISFECHGIEVTVIDFTLSRLYNDGYIFYNNLAEEKSLFEQTGDFQYEVYKLMKKHLDNQWQEAYLNSNVLWLKYLCEKMKKLNYSRPSSAAHKKSLEAIEIFNAHLTDCNSAVECLTTCGITTHVFARVILDSDLTKKSILVSRNSSNC